MREFERGETKIEVPRAEEDAISLLFYASIMWRYRWLIFSFCVATVSASFFHTVLQPKIFEAQATFIMPREGGGGLLGGLAAAIGVAQQLPGIGSLSLTPNRDMLMGLLRSRTMAEAVVKQFRLQERYGISVPEDAIRALQGSTSIIVKDGIMVVKVEDTDRWQAAEMANFYLQVLDRLVSRYGTTEAGRQRRFITEQIAQAKGNLDAAEEELRRFKERNRAIVLEAQTQDVIATTARLKGEIMAAEVQLEVSRNFATDANPEVVSLKRRISEMKRQLNQVEYGEDGSRRSGGGGRDRREINVPFASVPKLGVELGRLTREVKTQETLVTLLSQQREQTRIAESQDLPSVQILDPALPPERPSKPSIKRNVVFAGAVSLFLATLLAFLVDYARGVSARSHRP